MDQVPAHVHGVTRRNLLKTSLIAVGLTGLSVASPPWAQALAVTTEDPSDSELNALAVRLRGSDVERLPGGVIRVSGWYLSPTYVTAILGVTSV
jgi:hypothetical protein